MKNEVPNFSLSFRRTKYSKYFDKASFYCLMRNFQLAIFFSDILPLCWWSCCLNLSNFKTIALYEKFIHQLQRWFRCLLNNAKLSKEFQLQHWLEFFFSVTVKPSLWLTCSTWIAWITLWHIYIIELYQQISLLKLHQKQS